MTDEVDQAQAIEEASRERALRAQERRAGLIAGDWTKVSAEWCEGLQCGVRIPDKRRRALPGVRLCVECQGRAERLRKRGER